MNPRKRALDLHSDLLRPTPPPIAPARGSWVPACGGTETPFHTRSGRTLLYCWNQALDAHAYLDVGTDLILTDEEARAVLAI